MILQFVYDKFSHLKIIIIQRKTKESKILNSYNIKGSKKRQATLFKINKFLLFIFDIMSEFLCKTLYIKNKGIYKYVNNPTLSIINIEKFFI